MEKKTGLGGRPSQFSAEARNQIFERIRSGEFKCQREVMDAFKVSKNTVRLWTKAAGYSFASYREIGDPPPTCRDGNMDDKTRDMLKEKWKDHPFVEPDPGIESFKTPEAALEYYKLRAEYLENLYMLADSPTEVKKKALKLLDERIREKMAKGKTSV